jgi:two-component system chemotaxis response regulator CheY
MSKPSIICIDDQREILAALEKDLTPFKSCCDIYSCESADEARELLDEEDQQGKPIALLICDHLMARTNGVDFLIEVNEDPRFEQVKKLLLTGMATHKDTIEAINLANIDRYIEKPWDREELIGTVKTLLTQYLLSTGRDYQECLSLLDEKTLYKELRKRTGNSRE